MWDFEFDFLSFVAAGSRETFIWYGRLQIVGGQDRQANGDCMLSGREGQQWHLEFMVDELGEAAWPGWEELPSNTQGDYGSQSSSQGLN